MERLLISQLLKWKDSQGRKPLILEGARQVGKTWLLKEFGRKYFKDVCYINFEQSDVLEEIFAGDLSPQRIIEQLSIYNSKMIIPEETLIIFDEVQEMPRALTSYGLREYLEALGLDEYDPVTIIEKTGGRMAEDQQWLTIEVLK